MSLSDVEENMWRQNLPFLKIFGTLSFKVFEMEQFIEPLEKIFVVFFVETSSLKYDLRQYGAHAQRGKTPQFYSEAKTEIK